MQFTDVIPARSDFPDSRRDWIRDVLAGITVGVVALPLALGFGVASGAGAAAGMVTAVVAGLFGAIFGGSNFQVTGPTGAMTVVLIPAVAAHGAQVLPVLAIVSGAGLVVAGLVGVGRAVTLVPWPVVEGFTVGIAVVIFLQQLVLLLSRGAAPHGAMLVAATHAVQAVDWHATVPALAVAGGVMFACALVQRQHPTWPATLLALAVATLVVSVLDVHVRHVGAVALHMHRPWLPASAADVRDVLRLSVVVALLGALESLLSARVADGMSDSAASEPDRELVGQGLANVASGLVGGLPATGAIARTAVNVRAGARTRAAAMSHAIVIVVCVVAAAPLISRLPLAALNGVLMYTALRMIDASTVRSILRISRPDAFIFLATAAATVALDLVRAVELGVAISAIVALRMAARSSSVHEESLDDLNLDDVSRAALLRQRIVIYRLQGALFFGAAQRFLDRLADLDRARVVILRFGALHLIDSTGAHAIAEHIDSFRKRGVHVLVCGAREEHQAVLSAVGIPGQRVPEELMFTSLRDATTRARALAAAHEHDTAALM